MTLCIPCSHSKNILSTSTLINKYMWQKPLEKHHPSWRDIWYLRQHIGKNSLSYFMTEVSKNCNLSQKYTNHIIRVTGCMVLTRCSFSQKSWLWVVTKVSNPWLSTKKQKTLRKYKWVKPYFNPWWGRKMTSILITKSPSKSLQEDKHCPHHHHSNPAWWPHKAKWPSFQFNKKRMQFLKLFLLKQISIMTYLR